MGCLFVVSWGCHSWSVQVCPGLSRSVLVHPGLSGSVLSMNWERTGRELEVNWEQTGKELGRNWQETIKWIIEKKKPKFSKSFQNQNLILWGPPLMNGGLKTFVNFSGILSNILLVLSRSFLLQKVHYFVESCPLWYYSHESHGGLWSVSQK